MSKRYFCVSWECPICPVSGRIVSPGSRTKFLLSRPADPVPDEVLEMKLCPACGEVTKQCVLELIPEESKRGQALMAQGGTLITLTQVVEDKTYSFSWVVGAAKDTEECQSSNGAVC